MPTGSPANLNSIRGKVQTFRRGVPSGLIDSFINDRISSIVNGRTYWTDLLTRGIVSVPNAYSNGTVSVTTGSNLVIGGGPDSNGNYTGWPYNDAVDTAIATGVQYAGIQDVTPGSMLGITPDSWLYIDAQGPFPEVVAVLSTTTTSFRANFMAPHNPNATVWASSLAGRQFRMGQTSPVFTVIGVTTLTESGGTLLLDMPWGAASLSAQNYYICQMYYTFTPSFSKLLYVLDQQQGIEIEINKSITDLNWIDPQRTSTGPPTDFVPFGKNTNGNVIWELWPAQTSSYQLYYQVYQQWPELVSETDQPPPFIDSNIWVYGALADTLRYKTSKDDPFHNPKLADHYEQRYQMGVVAAYNADSSKMDFELIRDAKRYGLPGVGTQWWTNHDPDVYNWNL